MKSQSQLTTCPFTSCQMSKVQSSEFHEEATVFPTLIQDKAGAFEALVAGAVEVVEASLAEVVPLHRHPIPEK